MAILPNMPEDPAQKTEEMNRYIFNSCVITAPGQYSYRHIDIEEARRWMTAGPYQSTIRYRETARALAILVKQPIEIRAVVTHLEVGDQALVFRLAFPPGAGRLPVKDKGRISTSFILDHCEIGILERLPNGPAVPLEQYNVLAEQHQLLKRKVKLAINQIGEAIADNQQQLAYTLTEEILIELEAL